MERRSFLNLLAVSSALSLAPSALSAKDWRKEKPDAWTAHTVDDAIKAMYGSLSFVDEGVTITTPDVAANGGAVPVNVKSDLQAKSVSVFQNANPESAVITFDVTPYTVINFDMKMKLKSEGKPLTITAIVEGQDGKLYRGTRTLDVALGGCEG